MDTALFFESYYKNAEINSIMIMDSKGTVLDVNKSFTDNFGYINEEIGGKNFQILFTESDRLKNKPLIELQTVNSKGQANDENYVIDKLGHAIWCTGESILVTSKEGEKYIVKDIINLQLKKQLQLFLTETEELLEKIFESSKDIPMMQLDTSLKIQKVNKPFLQLFEMSEAPVRGSRLSDLPHPFWSEEIRKEMSKIIITNEPMKGREFLLTGKSGDRKTVRVESRVIDSQSGMGRKIFIIMEDISQ